MGASNSAESTGKVTFFNLKQKAGASENDTPGFAKSEKVDGSWKSVAKFDTLEGRLDKAEIVSKQFPNKKVPENFFVITMSDDQEKMVLTMPHGNLTYNIINALASNVNSLQMYKITVKKAQSKDGKYWNAQAYINVDGAKEMQKWSIDPQTGAPKPEPIMVNGEHFEVNGEKQYDRRKVIAFWEEVFKTKIIPKLSGDGSSRPAASSAPANTPSQPAASGAPAGGGSIDDNDDLPF